MTRSTQSPYVTHLYPAAAQPFDRGNANCTLKFNDYGTRVPPRSKKKRIVYLQPHESTTSRSRQRSYNFVQFIGQPDLIDHLKELIRTAHGMAPSYCDCDDIGLLNAHPSWATNPNHSELKDKDECSTSSPIDSKPDSTLPCQTPRECQTRSNAILKKPSMNEHAQQISATTSQHVQRSTQQLSANPEMDLPQSGSEDEDETWLTEPTGSKVTTRTGVVLESDSPAEVHLNSVEAFHQHRKTQPVAEPDLPRTPDPALSDHAKECVLPGPLSRDDDEDSFTNHSGLGSGGPCSVFDP